MFYNTYAKGMCIRQKNTVDFLREQPALFIWFGMEWCKAIYVEGFPKFFLKYSKGNAQVSSHTEYFIKVIYHIFI